MSNLILDLVAQGYIVAPRFNMPAPRPGSSCFVPDIPGRFIVEKAEYAPGKYASVYANARTKIAYLYPPIVRVTGLDFRWVSFNATYCLTHRPETNVPLSIVVNNDKTNEDAANYSSGRYLKYKDYKYFRNLAFLNIWCKIYP